MERRRPAVRHKSRCPGARWQLSRGPSPKPPTSRETATSKPLARVRQWRSSSQSRSDGREKSAGLRRVREIERRENPIDGPRGIASLEFAERNGIDDGAGAGDFSGSGIDRRLLPDACQRNLVLAQLPRVVDAGDLLRKQLQ